MDDDESALADRADSQSKRLLKFRIFRGEKRVTWELCVCVCEREREREKERKQSCV